jgi:hypothetical protein
LAGTDGNVAMLHDAPHRAGTTGIAPPADPAGLTPMLSVLLLLLAFFIMLVTMVEFDTRRTQAALGSINATFAARSAESLPDADGARENAEGAIRRLSVEIGEVLATLLRSGTFAVETAGSLAVIRIDNAELFAGGVTPAPALDAFASRFAGLLAAPDGRLRYQVEIAEMLGEAGATRRAGVIVRAVEAAGVAPNMLTISLAAPQSGQTRMEVHAFAPEEAAGQVPRAPVR